MDELAAIGPCKGTGGPGACQPHAPSLHLSIRAGNTAPGRWPGPERHPGASIVAFFSISFAHGKDAALSVPGCDTVMSVFKTYDVRGIWGQGIDPAFAYRLGRALPRYMKAKAFLIGRDARVHSPELYRALAAGLIDEGAAVTGIG